ncbi:MAG TPA: pilin [Candidatus Magasanikbacteria bacterium]|nr:pilin [Candidatus Magasanikbacteria bacterium]
MQKIKNNIIVGILMIGLFVPLSWVQAQSNWTKIYPKCIQEQMSGAKTPGENKACDDVGIFIELAINIGAYMFTFIGALALLVFVYGGFKMIISGGDSGKIKEAKDAMIAAVIGIVIAYSGVAIVKFLGDSLQLQDEYKLEQTPTTTPKNN